MTNDLGGCVKSEGRIHWTAKTRALIEPYERSPQASARQPDPEQAVALIRKALDLRVKQIEMGLPSADQHCRELMATVLESRYRPADAWLRDPIETDTARAVLAGVERNGARTPGGGTTYWLDADNSIDDAFLDLWSLRGGLQHAIEMLARCHSYDVVLVNHDRFCLESSEKSEPRWCPHDGIWLKLRLRLISCPDDEYEASRQAAARFRETSHLALRCSLDYAFPQEPGWAAADAERAVSGEAAGGREGRLLACVRDAALAERLASRGDSGTTAHVHTMLDLLGVAGAPAVEAILTGARGWAMSARRKLASQLAIIESPQVAAFFATHLADAWVVKAATTYFERWPDLARPALEEAAKARSAGAAELLQTLNARPLASDVCRAAQVRTSLQPERSREGPAPATGPPDLPVVLAAPPWTRASRAVQGPTVLSGVAPLSSAEHIEWQPGEREFHRSGRGCPFPWCYPEGEENGTNEPTEDDEDALESFREALRSGGKADLRSLFWLTEAKALDTWNTFPPEQYEFYEAADLHRLLARHGLDALPGFLRFGEFRLGLVVEILARVRSTRVAGLMAAAHAKLVRGRRIAAGWLLAYPTEAAVGLIPDAVGAPGPPRLRAEAALRFLASQGQQDVVRDVAGKYPREVGPAVAELLAFDPYEAYPRRLPDLHQIFWTPSRWPLPRLKESGQPLPDSAVEALGTMLAFSERDAPYAGIADVQRACDSRSLAAFAWALFEAWQKAGTPAKADWAFHALSLLGDGETSRQLAALIEPWSKEGHHGRAVTALGILAAMGTDASLARIREIAERAKSRPLRAEARARLEEMAERRGLSADQLADLLVPDLSFDASARRVLDFGRRRFVVTLDEQLRPVVKDEDGRTLRDLPKPARTDNAERAAAAAAEWKALKKDLRSVLKAETARFEQAMCARRRWSCGEFATAVLAHPLLGWLARRLVWGAYDDAGSLLGTFRVAEDRTLAGREDGSWSLPDGCSVGIVHAIDLDEAVRQCWSALLADYELEQPFAQLDREVFRAGSEDLPKRAITLLAGHHVAPRKLLTLESRGWDRIGGKDICVLVKRIHSPDCAAELPLDPGLFAGDLVGSPEQTLGPVVVRRLAMWSGENCLSIEEMGPTLYSELARDLMLLRG